ncbi:MAG: beta strand repeat-containing protein, partial [Ilumatobacteraceae bacterium]
MTALVGVGAVIPLSGQGPDVVAAAACGTDGTPNVLSLADPNFYIDASLDPALDSTYVGYRVTAGSSALRGARLELSGFTGGVVDLALGQSPVTVLPDIPAGTSAVGYFMLQASGVTTTPQTHTITLYQGSTAVCDRTFTFNRVHDTIKALANKVLGVDVQTPQETVGIGQVVNVVVTGKTGTLGNGPSWDPGVLSYSPTSLSGFPAGSWRLERTEMTISPDGSAPDVTYIDRLYLSGASGPDRPYTATYRYRAIAPAATSSPIQPVQYIASGTQVKHTDPSGSSGVTLPAISNEADLSLAKTADVESFPPVEGVVTGGRVTYTVSVVNAGSATGSVDSVVDTLPAGATFVAGSATVAGRSASPDLSGDTLTFYGPISVGPGGTTQITYQVDLPDAAGAYRNSAVAYLATSTIDGSRDVTASDPASVTVDVLPVGDVIAAVDDVASTSAETAVTIPVTANDTGSNVTVTITSLPANGTVVIDGTSVTYTPNAGFGGSDTFRYSISDGISSDTATVTVSVPVARNDSYAVGASANNSPTELTVAAADGLLVNDFCSDDPCTVQGTSVPAAGTLTLQTDGSFRYIAPTSAQVVTFTYGLTDASGNTADATVTIYVSDFGPDRTVTPYETLVVIPVTDNDVCQGTCNPTVSTSPTHGTAVRGTGDNIDYTPDAGFWGVDTFTYSKGGSGTTATVTVMVAPPPATFSTTPGTSVSGAPATPGYVDGLTDVVCAGCTYALGTPPNGGSVTINPSTGAFTYTPEPSTAGSDTFTYTVTEPGGLSVTGTVTVIVGPDAVDDSTSVFASSATVTRQVTFDVLDNDTCPPTCTVTVVTPPASGVLTQDGSTGSFTYSNQDTLGDITFTYRVVSSAAPDADDTATVTIRVEGALGDDVITANATAVDLDVQANDPCDECVASAVGTPAVGTATVTSGVVTYTPPLGFAGLVSFPYTVTKNGGSTTAVVTVTVAPDAVDDERAVVLGTTYDLAVLGNDVCSQCTITSVTSPTGGTATIDPTGSSVSYTAPSSGDGPFTFDYTLTDSTGLTATATVTLTVALAPTAVDDAVTTTAGSTISIDVAANDNCPSTCTVEVRSDPAAGSVSASVTGAIVFTPAAGFTGITTFTYALVGPDGLSTTATVTVNVTPVAVDDVQVMATSSTIAIPVIDNDLCDGCTIEIVTPPGAGEGTTGSIDATSISYTSPAAPGTYTFVYRIVEPDTDPTSSAEATVTIIVSDAYPDSIETDHDTPVTLDVIANDPCADLSPGCAVETVGTPNSGSVTIVDGTQVEYTPTAGFVGLATFTYTASNGSMSADATVTVLVGPPPRTATTPIDTPVTGDLLAGATCPNCEVVLVSFAGNGEVTINPDGTWSYTPAEGDTGTDEPITYRITDPVTGLTREGTLTITIEAEAAASVSISKTAGDIVDTDTDPNGAGDVGDTITYTFSVTNTGDDVLSDVTVTDDKIADADITCPDGTGNVVASLASGASTECSATYSLTQADVDAGSVTNIGTVTAGAGAGPVTDDDTATVTIDRSASLSVLKSAGEIVDTDDPADVAGDAGDTITYTYTVSSTGNVTLTAVTVTDDKIAGADISCDDVAEGDYVIDSLVPGDDVSCTAVYTLTQADVDAGSVTNEVSVSGTAPEGVPAPESATDSETVAITRSAALSVSKSAGPVADTDAEPNGAGDPGDTITYTYAVSNTGNVTLTEVTVTDNKIASSGISCDDVESGDNVIDTLAPGGEVSCS